jgi:hypothetical protein
MAFLGLEYHAEVQKLDDDLRTTKTSVIDRLWADMQPLV